MDGKEKLEAGYKLNDKEKLEAIDEVLSHLFRTDHGFLYDPFPDDEGDDEEHTLQDAMNQIIKITNTHVGYADSENY